MAMESGSGESNPVGNMGTDEAIDNAAKKIAKIRKDMEAIAKSAKDLAQSMQKASKVQGVGGGGRGTGAGNTGMSQPTGMNLGQVNNTSGGGRSSERSMSGGGFANNLVALGFAGANMGLAAIADYAVGGAAASEYERQRLMAFSGTGNFSRFGSHVQAAMNPYNVQNRSVLAGDVGYALGAGYAQMFGGGLVGERRAAMNVGDLHSIASMTGMDPNLVEPALADIYSAPTFYRAQSTGISTQNLSTGEFYGVRDIASQYFKKRGLGNLTYDEVMSSLAPGRRLSTELTTTFGSEAAAMIGQTIRLQTKLGRPLTDQDLEEAGLATDFFGTENTNIKDSNSERMLAEQERLIEFEGRVGEGIEGANQHLKEINEYLTGKGADSFVGDMEQAFGYLGQWNEVMPQFTSSVTGTLSNIATGILEMITNLVLLRALLGRGGGGGLLGGGGGGGRGAGLGRALLRVGGAATVATAGYYGTEHLINEYAGDTWDTSDSLGTIAAYAGTGAAIGSIIPGVGTAIGAVGGTVVGTVLGVAKSSSERNERRGDDVHRVDMSPAKGGRPRHSEGDWFVEKDHTADIHYGEMILPNRIAQAVRDELNRGKTAAPRSSGGSTVNIYLTLNNASDQEAVRFARRVKQELEMDNELMAIGNGRFA